MSNLSQLNIVNYDEMCKRFPEIGTGSSSYSRSRRSQRNETNQKEIIQQLKTQQQWETFIQELPSQKKQLLWLEGDCGKDLLIKVDELECVDLGCSDSKLTDEQIIPLAKLLQEQGKSPQGRKVHVLHLDWNAMGPVGAIALAEAIKVNRFLGACEPRFFNCEDTKNYSSVAINLSYNQSGPEGYNAIAEAVLTTGRTAWNCLANNNPLEENKTLAAKKPYIYADELTKQCSVMICILNSRPIRTILK